MAEIKQYIGTKPGINGNLGMIWTKDEIDGVYRCPEAPRRFISQENVENDLRLGYLKEHFDFLRDPEIHKMD